MLNLPRSVAKHTRTGYFCLQEIPNHRDLPIVRPRLAVDRTPLLAVPSWSATQFKPGATPLPPAASECDTFLAVSSLLTASPTPPLRILSACSTKMSGGVTDDVQGITAPAGVTMAPPQLKEATRTTLEVSWSEFSTAIGYAVEYSSVGYLRSFTLSWLPAHEEPYVTGTSFTRTGLAEKTEYAFRITPVLRDDDGTPRKGRPSDASAYMSTLTQDEDYRRLQGENLKLRAEVDPLRRDANTVPQLEERIRTLMRMTSGEQQGTVYTLQVRVRAQLG